MTNESRTRYRVADRDRVDEAMGYMLARVSRLAAGYSPTWHDRESVEAARTWAQELLDEMVADGYIEPRPEEPKS